MSSKLVNSYQRKSDISVFNPFFSEDQLSLKNCFSKLTPSFLYCDLAHLSNQFTFHQLLTLHCQKFCYSAPQSKEGPPLMISGILVSLKLLIKHTFSPLWIPNRAQFFYIAIQRRRLVLYSRLSFSDSATAELLYDNFTLSSQMHIWYRLMNIMFMKQDLFANWIVYHTLHMHTALLLQTQVEI